MGRPVFRHHSESCKVAFVRAARGKHSRDQRGSTAMKTLALEMSTAQGSIVWREDEKALFDCRFAADRKHSGAFFENLQLCLERFGRPEQIIVGLGPGSYAGIRIAIATALGLRSATRAKLMGI